MHACKEYNVCTYKLFNREYKCMVKSLLDKQEAILLLCKLTH